jgi:hypothetical protein
MFSKVRIAISVFVVFSVFIAVPMAHAALSKPTPKNRVAVKELTPSTPTQLITTPTPALPPVLARAPSSKIVLDYLPGDDETTATEAVDESTSQGPASQQSVDAAIVGVKEMLADQIDTLAQNGSLADGDDGFVADDGSVLDISSGGTGIDSYNPGDILYADADGNLEQLPIGTSGQVLEVTDDLPSWADQTTPGVGAWATTTDDLAIYPGDPSQVIIVGNDATTTDNSIFEVTGSSYFSSTVAIGTTTPWRTLSVNGTASFTGLTTESGGNGSAVCLSANNELIVNSGAQTCTLSSERYKHDIQASDAGLATVLAMQPVTFYYNQDTGDTNQEYGFIAEQVQQVDPRLVDVDAQGQVQTVRYEEYTAVLTKAIQELNGEIAPLSATTTISLIEAQNASTSTTTPWIGSFGSSSTGLQGALAAVDTAVVHILGTAVYAVNGIFDNIFAKQVHTDVLCVGQTCVNEAQLKTLLNQSGQTGSTPPEEIIITDTPSVDTGSSTPSDTSSSTPPDTTNASSTPPSPPVTPPAPSGDSSGSSTPAS